MALKKRFPNFRQTDQFDCGPTCLKIMSNFYGRNFNLEHLRDVCNITPDGITLKSLLRGAESLGFKCVPANISYSTLEKKAPLPCITYWRDRHFLIVYKISNGKVYVSDPAHGLIKYEKDEFTKAWQNTQSISNDSKGMILLMEPSAQFYSQVNTNFSEGFRTLLPYLKNYSRYIFQVCLGLVLGSIIQLVLPFLTQKMIDKGIGYGDINFVWVLLIAQLTLFLSSSFITVIRNWLLLYVGSRVNMLVSSDYLYKLLSKTVSFFDTKTPGDIVQRINETSRLETFLTQAPTNIFLYLNALAFLLILAYYNWLIFLVFSIGIILYTLWIKYFMKKRADLDFKRFDASSSMNSRLIQIVGGIQDVKVNKSERKHIRGWEKVRVSYFQTAMQGLKLSQFQSVGGGIINELKNIIITFIAALLVIEGKLTLGGMVAIQYIIGQINGPLATLINFFSTVQDARLTLDRFKEIDHITNEQAILNNNELLDLPNDGYDISIQNLNFSYTNDKDALVLKNINLHIPKGSITAIVGDSGSGKTTLLKLLLKLYLPQSGDIFINNYNLRNISSESWSSLCGTVMQDGYIFSNTITENIIESASEEAINVEKLLYSVKLANIEELINTLPAGFNSTIGPSAGSGRTLSGGERQRVLIARAVYKNPHFLFFDEATSALDANNEKVIMENLKSFFIGKTVIVIAHRLSTVKNADQIVVLEGGEIKERGTHNELLKNKGPYYTLVKNQLELGN